MKPFIHEPSHPGLDRPCRSFYMQTPNMSYARTTRHAIHLFQGCIHQICSTPNRSCCRRTRSVLGRSILLDLSILFRLRVIRTIIFLLTRGKELPRATSQTVQPEQIETLKHSQQGKGNDVRDPAFILLSLPIEFVGTDSPELREQGVKNTQVQVVSQIDPCKDIESVKGDDQIRSGVVEGFGDLQHPLAQKSQVNKEEHTTYRKEEVTNIVSRIRLIGIM